MEEAFMQKTGQEWLKIMEGKVPIGPINTVDMALSDPQVVGRNMVVEATHRSGEKMKLIGNPIKMSQAEDKNFTPPPAVGEHTDRILQDLLNFSPPEIKQLREKKVI